MDSPDGQKDVIEFRNMGIQILRSDTRATSQERGPGNQ